MSTFKLAIGNIVHVPVKFTLNDDGEDKEFEFKIKANRMAPDEINKFQKDPTATVPDFMKRAVFDWEGQKLILNEDGSPANFSAEAFDAMLKVSGMPFVLYSLYLKASGAKEKN